MPGSWACDSSRAPPRSTRPYRSSCGLELARLREGGDHLPGDVIVATHICPRASIRPHHPVPFMVSPIDQQTMNRHEVDPAMDALLCVDTTRGNRILNRRGLAITPTVKEGYILRVSEDLLDIVEAVTGRPPAVADRLRYGSVPVLRPHRVRPAGGPVRFPGPPPDPRPRTGGGRVDGGSCGAGLRPRADTDRRARQASTA